MKVILRKLGIIALFSIVNLVTTLSKTLEIISLAHHPSADQYARPVYTSDF